MATDKKHFRECPHCRLSRFQTAGAFEEHIKTCPDQFSNPQERFRARQKLRRKGFIQIPVLIAIIIGTAIIGISVGVIRYQNIKQAEFAEEQRAKETQEALVKLQQEQLSMQREALEQTKQEIEVLKQKQAERENKPPQIIVKQSTNEITSSEINQYLEAVVSIDCFDASGSGFLWTFPNKTHSIITNEHVVESCRESSDFGCWCWATANNIKGDGIASLRMQISLDASLNPKADIKSSVIKTNGPGDLERLNYQLASARQCPNLMPIGSPVVIIGYPAFAVQSNEVGNLKYERITTDGKISGYAEIDLITRESLAINNYYVSATVDSGNSGGVALSKNEEGLCLLGVPTWLKLGNFETQGVVQNIHNIFK